jgi:hypothetical protein
MYKEAMRLFLKIPMYVDKIIWYLFRVFLKKLLVLLVL